MLAHRFERKETVYSLLGVPWAFTAARSVIAPGATDALRREVGAVLSRFPVAGSLLDVGCGPRSWLSYHGVVPIGVDISFEYMKACRDRGACPIVASAVSLPFPDDSFDGVWNVGLLHHLPDSFAVRALSEMTRVVRTTGYVAVIDAVMPKNSWKRPLAAGICRMDRGKYVRKQREFEDLLPRQSEWAIERRTISPVGIETVTCVLGG